MNRQALLVTIALGCGGCNAIEWNFGAPGGDASASTLFPPIDEAGVDLSSGPDGSMIDLDLTDAGPLWAFCVKGGCPTTGLHCNSSSGQCVPCLEPKDCTDPDLTVCDLVAGDRFENLCVACVHDSDCNSASSSSSPAQVCVTNQCVQSCSHPSDCKSSAATCSRSLCLGCQSKGDCPSKGSSNCNLATGRCVPCADDGDCSGQKPKCDLRSNSCVGCLNSQDCEGGLCDPEFELCTGDSTSGGKMWDQ